MILLQIGLGKNISFDPADKGGRCVIVCITYVIVLASSMKLSSDIVSSFITLTATMLFSHTPSYTFYNIDKSPITKHII